MGADARDHVGEPRFRLDAVEPGGSHERVERGGPLASGIGTTEQPILSSDSCRPDLVFCGVVADFEPAVVEVARERMPPRAGIADGAGEIALARDFLQLCVEPDG